MSPPKNGKIVRIDFDTESEKEFTKDLIKRFCNLHILQDHPFPEYQDESKYDFVKRVVEAMELADVEKKERGRIFAFIRTGRFLTTENMKLLSSEVKKEWFDAIEEYEGLVEEGFHKPSDSLVPFIEASKSVSNPRRSRKELEHLFDTRNLHSAVVEASKHQFINNDFPSSVFNAYKKLLAQIQDKSDDFFEDGVKLVTSIFNPEKPVLQSSLAKWTADTSIQEGIMHLFMGAVLCVRNVFAHKSVYLTNPNDTLEYLSFASFLFKILDVLKVREDNKALLYKKG
jgi:uncharacterized protein (TIGR02391 family)